MEDEDSKRIPWPTSLYPEEAISLSEHQLEFISKGLRATILGTAQAFYRYILSPSNLSPSTKALFDEWVDFDNPNWQKIRQQFTCAPDIFAERMHDASITIAKDNRFCCYSNTTDGYTLTLPYPAGDSFDNACIDLFCGTRLARAEKIFPETIGTDEGKRWEGEDEYNKPTYFFEFDEAENLCRFANLALLPHIQVSTHELQATRH